MGAEDVDRQRAWEVHQAMVLLAGVLIPLVGVAYHLTAPDELDPMGHRLAFLVAAVGLVALERWWPAARAWGNTLAFALGAAFVAWFLWTASAAGFSIGRVMGLFTLQFAASLLFRSPVANAAWQVAMIGMTAVALGETDGLRVSRGMLLAAMGTIGVMSATGSVAGDRMLRALEEGKRALAEAHDRLEERVRVRTSALRREVEERRAAEERAEAANLAKSRFLANMSHELRTPLNAIVGYTELVAESLPAGSPEAHDAGRVLAAAEHLRRLIDEVLDLSRIEAGRLSLDLAEVPVASVVEEATAIVARSVAEHGNTLAVHVPDDAPTVRADRGRLLQILANLLSNAARFTERGAIEVSVEVRDGVRVAVRDTGVGIAPDQLPRLFQKFTQVDDSPTRRHGGTGLGLAISQELAALHGGRIEVVSAPGVGSTFTLVLPERCVVPRPAVALAGFLAGDGV